MNKNNKVVDAANAQALPAGKMVGTSAGAWCEPRWSIPPVPVAQDAPRVAVTRHCHVTKLRGAATDAGSAPVDFVAVPEGGKQVVVITPCDDTSIRLTMDDLLDTVFALCPPWLVRKKLGW